MSADVKRIARGFTLIEVLVALAIVAFGLIAVFGQLNQSATAAGRLRDKTFANWIAMNLLTQRRLNDQFPSAGSSESDDVEMANGHWHYEIKYSDADLEGIRRADVTVALADSPTRPVATAVGYIVQRTVAQGVAGAGAGFPPWNLTGEPGAQQQTEKPAPVPTPTPGGAEP